MAVKPPLKRRASGLRPVLHQRDLRPYVNTQPAARRMPGTSGVYLSDYVKQKMGLVNPDPDIL